MDIESSLGGLVASHNRSLINLSYGDFKDRLKKLDEFEADAVIRYRNVMYELSNASKQCICNEELMVLKSNINAISKQVRDMLLGKREEFYDLVFCNIDFDNVDGSCDEGHDFILSKVEMEEALDLVVRCRPVRRVK